MNKKYRKLADWMPMYYETYHTRYNYIQRRARNRAIYQIVYSRYN